MWRSFGTWLAPEFASRRRTLATAADPNVLRVIQEVMERIEVAEKSAAEGTLSDHPRRAA
jgi:hypothetical protein